MAYTKDEQRFADQLQFVVKMHEAIKCDWQDGYWPTFDRMKTYCASVDKLFHDYCDETDQHGVVSSPRQIKRGS